MAVFIILAVILLVTTSALYMWSEYEQNATYCGGLILPKVGKREKRLRKCQKGDGP